jgi:hypothetical protein
MTNDLLNPMGAGLMSGGIIMVPVLPQLMPLAFAIFGLVWSHLHAIHFKVFLYLLRSAAFMPAYAYGWNELQGKPQLPMVGEKDKTFDEAPAGEANSTPPPPPLIPGNKTANALARLRVICTQVHPRATFEWIYETSLLLASLFLFSFSFLFLFRNHFSIEWS